MPPAIEIEGLGKRYQLGATHDRTRRLSEAITDAFSRPFKREGREARARGDHWAIEDLSLTIQQGEVVGFVGRNGAGKSTLLKLLSRVTEPTTGVARLHGRVGALLEVGTGFHAELSGRENIYLNGAILGMARRDIQRRFDEIVEFSEVGRFLDTPVKRYSSGMYVRLAFAVAAHLEPEILLVDEVLAVGDAAFQRKCLGKMEQVAGEGRTVLFVSHNMATVQSLCQRAYLLEGGRLIEEGEARAVVHRYLSEMNQTATVSLEDRTDRQGDGSVRFTTIDIDSADGAPTMAVGTPVRFALGYRSEGPLRNARVLISILDVNRTAVFLLDSAVHGGLPEELPAEGSLVCETAPLMITPGRCYVNVRIVRQGVLADLVTNAAVLDIVDDDPLGLGEMPVRAWALNVVDQTWRHGRDEDASAGGAAVADVRA